MSKTWVRRHPWYLPSRDSFDDIAGWHLWLPRARPRQSPLNELAPGFTYFACDKRQRGRQISHRLTVTQTLPAVQVADLNEAYDRAIASGVISAQDYTPPQWRRNEYNAEKQQASWPKGFMAWRIEQEELDAPVAVPSGVSFWPSGWAEVDQRQLEAPLTVQGIDAALARPRR